MSNMIKKDAAQWSNAELEKWANGELEAAKPLTERKLADEVIKRRQLEEGLSVSDVKALLTGNVEPTSETEEPVTSETTEVPEEEVEKPQAEEAPVAETETPKENTPTKAPAVTKMVSGGNEKELALEVIQQNLEDYITMMAPGRSHRGTEGPIQQVKLYRTVQMVLRQKGSTFHRAFGYLLDFVNQHRKGAFNELYIYRYFDSRQMKTSLPAGERKKFERILNLLITTCNPKTRSKTMEQVDIDATMESFRGPEMHQRVLGFYKGL